MISAGHCIGALHIGALFGKPGGKKVVFSSTVPNLKTEKDLQRMSYENEQGVNYM